MSLLFKLQLKAGNHNREFCPVSFRMADGSTLLQGNPVSSLIVRAPGGEAVALQTEEEEDGTVILHWIVSGIAAGEAWEYEVHAEQNQKPSAHGVQLVEKENQIDIVVGGQYFTSYVIDPAVAKPYVGPVMGPYGESFTRLDFTTREHPHHRSLWLAIGDVNGIDFWNEPAERHGKQIITGISEKSDGPVFAKITSTQNWCTYKGGAQLQETRTITFYNTPANRRFIDLDFEFYMNKGQIEFGATKEAGPLGIRVAESMKVENGGTIVNSFGSVGEKECWGQRAQWCDYYGNVGGHTLGIAAFDHPDNDNFPTYWHVRDYGLLAANNFYFDGGKLFKKGQSIRYKHRVYFHEGDTAAGRVGDKYHDYIHPPEVKLAP